MATMTTVEELALELSVSERATLASTLLSSLPPVLHDEDDGYAEAERRRQEFLANPEIGITPEELRLRIAERFDI
jgi:putative addiction module component (TIGR02574 family)